MRFRFLFLAALVFAIEPLRAGQNDWPQAAGPNGNWQVESENVPTKWSVTRNENIRWRTPMPEAGINAARKYIQKYIDIQGLMFVGMILRNGTRENYQVRNNT